MELTNLMFAVLLAFVFVSGFFLFYFDMANSYPNLQAASPGLANLSASMNQTSASLDSLTNSTLTQSTNTQNLNAAAIFGYVTGAINGLSALVNAPNLFMNVVNAFSSSMGFALIPSFMITAIGAAVIIITLIGLLFYLLKVK